MTNHPWSQQTVLVCVDSYENGVPMGKLYLPGQQAERFGSLSRMLLQAEGLLEQSGALQSFTTPRIFSQVNPPQAEKCDATSMARGALATFEVRVMFRQHASWQGEVLWLEGSDRQSFRSVLELITLMDSALRRNM